MGKSKKIISEICAALLLVCTWSNSFYIPKVSAENGPNLVPNGDFEDTSDSSWLPVDETDNKASFTLDDKIFHGSYGHSQKIQGTSVDSEIGNIIPIEAGKEYTVSAWLRGENIKVVGNEGGAFLVVQQLDKDLNPIEGTNNGLFDNQDFDWDVAKFNFVADSKAANIIIMVGLQGSGTVWTDDISISEFKPDVTRLSGQDRISTSIQIANEQFSSSSLDAVVLTTAFNFPDALSGANLAYKYNAPILLVNKTVDNSKSTLDYVTNKLPKGKTVYILGGNGAVSNEISDYLVSLGYVIERLNGNSRYETNQKIFQKLNVTKGTPIVLATGNGFADALSVSSIAAINGYPILLNSKDQLLSNVKDDISNILPSTVYIVGGSGVLSTNIEDEIRNISGNISIVRLNGKDRYETSRKIIEYFKLNTDTIAVATGEDFPDALSGSFLAAKKNAGILLVNNNDTSAQKNLIKNSLIQNIYVFGGESALKTSTINSLR